ncbi:phosphoadenosine phosphosulfate reductase [Radiomyces spectabilis]|uniref:phosphoadenosine phosphosulfate reductase n=1 Tax=Radiomyces spectabilis TaxID=64574 RepID=UPI0022211474|nr:phosphoadenosine phosphosulfate reductase [Radiomyces spectabilis]KAI8381480.1 phosphoadenosine phosphosulfate reductase [Radiomyces spectabilis]
MPTSTATRIHSGADLSPEKLAYLNDYLQNLSPHEILEWAIDNLPQLFQTTAFGLTGLVTLDMINKISIDREQPHLVPLIFLDTLYHFNETLDLARRCQETYEVPLKVYKPMDCETVQEFEREHGTHLWETDEDSYDYLVKVEPARRAYEELDVRSVITGRRRSQKGDRESIPILEVDDTGLIKLNPLAYWDYQQVWTYIRANEVPYNALVDQGYRSIGDWHSTRKPSNDNSERSGRWAGSQKTECGLHKDYFKMRAAFMAAKRKKEQLLLEQQQQQQKQTAVMTTLLASS